MPKMKSVSINSGIEGASGKSGNAAQRRVAATSTTRGGHREDRADRGAQQGETELGIIQAKTILNGRNARHPAAKHGAKEEKEARCSPARVTQVIGVTRAVADSNSFDYRNTRPLPFDDAAVPQMAGQTVT
jgi:hypothetical protein